MSSTVVTGTPAFFGDTMGGTTQNWSVFVPLPSRNLGAFLLGSTNGVWTFSNLGGLFVGPATSHQTGAFIRGRTTGLWTWTGSGPPSLVGGLFD